MRSIFVIVTIFVTLLMPRAFAEDLNTAAELERFQSLKAQLATLGVPQDPYVLDFLTLELFYNVPGRAVVADSIADVKVEDFHWSITHTADYNLWRMFPQWKNRRSAKRELHLKSIRITGHRSCFVWDPKEPDIYFIYKPGQRSAMADAVTDVLKSDSLRIKDLNFDFVEERSAGEKETVRRLSTNRIQAGEHLYPLHGFLASPLLTVLALKWGMSRYQFLKEVFIPHFADTMFDGTYRLGLWFQSHTQNLWLVVNDDGSFHLANKDFAVTLIDDLVRQKDPTYWRTKGEVNVTESYLKPVNSTSAQYIREEPRFSEPGYSFAMYPLQTIIHADDLSFRQQLELIKVYFARMSERVLQIFGFQIQFSEEVREVFDDIPRYSHEFDLRGFSVWTGRGIFTRAKGLIGFSEQVMREMQDQIYQHLLGPRSYPTDSYSQKILRELFDLSSRKYQLHPVSLPGFSFKSATVMEKVNAAKNFLIALPYALAVSIRDQLKFMVEYHYEYTAEYVLLVNRHGQVLQAIPHLAPLTQIQSVTSVGGATEVCADKLAPAPVGGRKIIL